MEEWGSVNSLMDIYNDSQIHLKNIIFSGHSNFRLNDDDNPQCENIRCSTQTKWRKEIIGPYFFEGTISKLNNLQFQVCFR